MKVIIAGSRTFSIPTNPKNIFNWIENSGFEIDEIISGTAKGADFFGEYYADLNKIPVKKFYPNWNKYGRAAGPIRNLEMAKYADALLAIWDSKSDGTRNMISCMEQLNKPYRVYCYETE